METGAKLMHLDDGYWQRLDRRLELMGEEADGRLY